jgi:methionyl-tRNA formyltransferase
MKVVFFGTPDFAAKVLAYLFEHKINIVGVITKPDRPKGRSGSPVPTPVKVVAQSHNPLLQVLQPELVSAPEVANQIAAFQADLFVVVAYGEIIKQHLLDMPLLGCINVHASLLPKYRGAAPIQRSLINGDPISGITIMHMVKKMDAGDIINIVEVPIGPNTIFTELEQALCHAGCQALLEVIKEFEAGIIRRIPQDESKVTYAPKIELEDCELKWEKTASELHNLVRGVTPEPGAWCYIQIRGQKKRLKVLTSRVISTMSGIPGSILAYGKEGLIIACGKEALQILDLQLEGKKAMPAIDLMRGLPQEQFSL